MSELAAKRFELLQDLRLTGLSGAEAIKVAIDSTEDTIDEALRRAKEDIRSSHERYRQARATI